MKSFFEMLLFAGLPFVLTFAVTAVAFPKKSRSESTDKQQSNSNSESKIAQWARENAMSICFGGAFLIMLVIAAVTGLVFARLSLSVRVYYAVCGGAMGVVCATALAMLKRLQGGK